MEVLSNSMISVVRFSSAVTRLSNERETMCRA